MVCLLWVFGFGRTSLEESSTGSWRYFRGFEIELFSFLFWKQDAKPLEVYSIEFMVDNNQLGFLGKLINAFFFWQEWHFKSCRNVASILTAVFFLVSDRDKNLYVYMYLPEGESYWWNHRCVSCNWRWWNGITHLVCGLWLQLKRASEVCACWGERTSTWERTSILSGGCRAEELWTRAAKSPWPGTTSTSHGLVGGPNSCLPCQIFWEG